MAKPTYRRTRKLIKPRFQLKVAAACFGIALMAVLVLMSLIHEVVLDFADRGWVDAALVQEHWTGALLGKMAMALALLAPLTLALGVLLMHRVAGPLYRFEVYLRQVLRGETTEPCRIRKGDELQEFCDLLNAFTQPLRDGRADAAPFAAALAALDAAALPAKTPTPEAPTPTPVGEAPRRERAPAVS